MAIVTTPVTLVAGIPSGLATPGIFAAKVVNSTASPVRTTLGPGLYSTVQPGETRFFNGLGASPLAGFFIVLTGASGGTVTVTTYQQGDPVPGDSYTYPGVPDLNLGPPPDTVSAYSSILRGVYNVKDFGAVGGNSTYDIPAALDAIGAASINGGQVYWPGCASGYSVAGLPIVSNVHHVGDGITATLLKCPNGANTDVFSALTANININAATGTGSSTAVSNFGFRNMTIGGNKGNQSAGPAYCIRVYGYGFIFENLVCSNGFSGGIQVDWNANIADPTPDSMEARMHNVKVHDCGGIGLEWGGPHDSQWARVICKKNSSHNIHIGPHAQGIQGAQIHPWGNVLGTNSVGLLLEGDASVWTACTFEGSDVAQVVVLSNYNSFQDCSVFGIDANPASAFQIGQASGLTPFNGSAFQTGGLTTLVQVFGNEFDCDYSHVAGTNGIFFLGAGGVGEFGPNTYKGHAWLSGGKLFNVNPNMNSLVQIGAGGAGGPTPLTYNGGNEGCAESPTSVAIATSGTIATAGYTVSRVNPAAAVTGVILAAGTVPGQRCIVRNEAAAANTVTFAVAGTSHVADGASSPIAGLTSREFIWSVANGLWSRVA